MLWAVIIAGGGGTRFWPESRAARPKQFLNIFGKKTLLEETYARIAKLIPRSRVVVMTDRSHIGEVRRLLRLGASQVIGEPVGRNTAPAAILAASYIYRKDPAAVLAILPSDHKIKKPRAFQKALREANRATISFRLPVTFGIKPAYPHTGYGYLEMEKIRDRSSKADLSLRVLKQFHEKPDLAKAKSFVRSGRFLWNSGMFVWRAEDLLAAAKKYLPVAYKLAQEIVRDRHCEDGQRMDRTKQSQKPRLLRPPLNQWRARNDKLKRLYPSMPNISIDYALMEPMQGKILALPVDMGWSDLGGWQAIAELLDEDQHGNCSRAQTILIDSRRNIIKSERRLVAMIGMENCIVVDSGNALLIARRDKAEDVRKVVAELKRRRFSQYL